MLRHEILDSFQVTVKSFVDDGWKAKSELTFQVSWEDHWQLDTGRLAKELGT